MGLNYGKFWLDAEHAVAGIKLLQVLAFQKSWRSFSPITVCIIAQCQCQTGGEGGLGPRAPTPHEEAVVSVL